MKPTWRKVGLKAEAELRTGDGELLQAFLRVGSVWYTRESDGDEWERCAPAIVPVRVADLLREAA